MESNRQKLGLAALALLLAAGAAGLAMGRVAQSLAAQASTMFAGLGLLATAVSVFLMRLEQRERLEKLEFDELSKSASPGSNLFTTEAESFPARHTREQFEKYFVPAAAFLLLAGEAAGCVLLWRWLLVKGADLAKAAQPVLQQHMALMAVFGLFALLLFMLGKYVSGVARLENNRLLRPMGGYLLLNAYLSASVVATGALDWAEFHKVDLWVGRLYCGVMGLLAVEMLAGLVFEMYRPRVKGREARLLHDSRLVGLLSQPESLVTALAHALDYQFGFKVSETRFYQFLEKALAWVVLAQFGILILSTVFVVIEPGEQALLERLGRPVEGRQLLGPGPHFKLPWPVDRIYRYRTEQLQSFTVGIVADEKDHGETVLWSVGHAKEEYNLLVANAESGGQTNADSAKKIPPVNLLAVNIPVEYQVTNLMEWAYRHTEAPQVLESAATREVVRYLVSADINDLMSQGRGRAAEQLQQRIQAAVEERHLGARIVFVGLAGIHPPVAVAEHYEKVVGARQQAEAKILSAQAYQIRTNALARATAYRKVQEAQAEKLQLEQAALARAAAFTNQIPAYAAAPGVYSWRAYLQTLTRTAGDTRKYVLASTNTEDVLQFNLEDKLRLDLLDVAPPVTKPK